MNKTLFALLWLQVVHAVGGKIPVLFDGGVRRGTDVFKALALGAQAVLVSHPFTTFQFSSPVFCFMLQRAHRYP